MSRESGYFEESGQLFGDADANVGRISNHLYWRMFKEFRDNGTVPLPGFNILYFMQAVIHCWNAIRSYVPQHTSSFPYSCEPIRGVNWPAALDSKSNVRELATHFMARVERDSVSNGNDLDVSYAMKIISLSFCEGTELTAYVGDLDDVDSCLAAFDTT